MLACFTLSCPYGSHALNSTLQEKKIQLTETDMKVLQVVRPVKTWHVLKEVGMFILKKARHSGGVEEHRAGPKEENRIYSHACLNWLGCPKLKYPASFK